MREVCVCGCNKIEPLFKNDTERIQGKVVFLCVPSVAIDSDLLFVFDKWSRSKCSAWLHRVLNAARSRVSGIADLLHWDWSLAVISFTFACVVLFVVCWARHLSR